MRIRVASGRDLDGVASTLAAAFEEDPLWRWAFPEPEGLAEWWRFCVGGALRYPWVWVADEYAAASVWIPPGGLAMTQAEEATVERRLVELAGERTGDVVELLERFEEGHPKDRPHFYLSLLGTHPDYRGQGLGTRLLERNLELIDREGLPAYLESSNPRNNRRYEQLGFEQIGELSTPDEQVKVATMWREPG